MIFIDTSVWIQYFRGGDEDLNQTLRDFLDQDNVAISVLVWLELLSGARKSELPLLKRVLSALPRFEISSDCWRQVESWIENGIKSGQRFGVADLLIASTVVEQQGILWSLDSDFKRMEKLGFLKLFK